MVNSQEAYHTFPNPCVCVSHSVVSDSWRPHGLYQAPLSMGFSMQEYWSRLPFSSPGDLPNKGIKPKSRALQADSLLFEPLGKPPNPPNPNLTEENL